MLHRLRLVTHVTASSSDRRRCHVTSPPLASASMATETGAEALVRALAAAGVEVCFANPGTTEMFLVGALDAVPSIRPLLCLHETVCAGAADGYARMARKPAATLLHLGPGLANALAALHNARRARSPVLNLVGDMATWHAGADAPLAMDIEALACTVSGLVRTCADGTAAQDGADAMAAAVAAPRGAYSSRVATLIVPHDVTWAKAAPRSEQALGQAAAAALSAARRVRADGAADPAAFIASCAAALRAAPRGSVALLLGGDALLSEGGGLAAAASVAAALGGAPLLCANNFARVDRGGGLPPVTRLPYFPKDAQKALSAYTTLLLVDAPLPVPMFGYEAGPAAVCALPDDAVWQLDGADAAGTLRQLAAALGAPPPAAATAAPPPPRTPLPSSPAAPLTSALLCATVAALQPAGAIIVEESLTSGGDYWALSASAPAFSHLTLTGGAIGFGPPAALGAAVACPGRRVINLQADGSGMYAPQALWSQARAGADVITIICANQRYAILKLELALQRVAVSSSNSAMNQGANQSSNQPASRSLTDLASPPLDWCAIAQGMGVRAVRAATAGELAAALREALARPEPTLIEAMLV